MENVLWPFRSARMAARVATGGHRNTFETEMGLYRKTSGFSGSNPLFDAKIQPGGAVILGEEVLLRAVVRDGDGEQYTAINNSFIHTTCLWRYGIEGFQSFHSSITLRENNLRKCIHPHQPNYSLCVIVFQTFTSWE